MDETDRELFELTIQQSMTDAGLDCEVHVLREDETLDDDPSTEYLVGVDPDTGALVYDLRSKDEP